jgi:hypothetical protein
VGTHPSHLFKTSMSILIRSHMLHANIAPLVILLAFGVEPLRTIYCMCICNYGRRVRSYTV